MSRVRPTLYEYAGGDAAFLRLSRAMNARCLADPELNHPFSHRQTPDHDERLGSYWAEVLGGPPRYTDRYGSQTSVVRMHAGNRPPEDWNERFVACFLAALDDAGLPDNPEFRATMRAYMEWAVTDTNAYPDSAEDVPDDLVVPRWGWDGLHHPRNV